MKRDWDKTIKALDSRLEVYRRDLDDAERNYRLAALAAVDGPADGSPVNNALRDVTNLKRVISDTLAAREAAMQSRDIEAEKHRKSILSARQRKIVQAHKDLRRAAEKIDAAFDQLVAEVEALATVAAQLQAEGVRPASRLLLNLNRCLGSRVNGKGFRLGEVFGVDEQPRMLVEMVPDLQTVLAESERDQRVIQRALDAGNA